MDRVELLRLLNLEANEASCNAEYAQSQARTGYASDAIYVTAASTSVLASHTKALALFAELLCDMFPANPEGK